MILRESKIMKEMKKMLATLPPPTIRHKTKLTLFGFSLFTGIGKGPSRALCKTAAMASSTCISTSRDNLQGLSSL
uniref:Uncharacterized protein n=1 Tax=Romanomermis culicivorax TaxID=13658 RepID=A0A915HQ24_ROMCU